MKNYKESKVEEKEIFERIQKATCYQLNVGTGEVNMETNFANDLGADSLDRVELVMAFEEEFGLEIDDDDAEKIFTVSDAVATIKKLVEAPIVG